MLSVVFDSVGRAAGKAVTTASTIPVGGELIFEQKINVAKPPLWSLEDRNLYTLVSEVRTGGDVADSTTRFSAFAPSGSIRSSGCCSMVNR